MNAYRITRQEGDLYPTWEPTLADAHAAAKVLTAANPFDEIRIELFDVPTDKESILQLLNGGDADSLGLGAQKTWGLTVRRGLNELNNGE